MSGEPQNDAQSALEQLGVLHVVRHGRRRGAF